MRLNNYQTELEIGNDFNRRIRNDDTGETLQEIKAEDDERTTSFKSLLNEYNKNLAIAVTEDDKDEIKDKYENDKITQNRKYNKPTIMKVSENNKFNIISEKTKKIAKKFDNLKLEKPEITQSDYINELINDKKTFYRMTKEEKDDILNELSNANEGMNKEIEDKTAKASKIQKIGRNYIKKVKDNKIKQDKINKEYLSYIHQEKKIYNENDIDELIDFDSVEFCPFVLVYS